jgi:ABC-type nitrate/sulfonate/bicarbonate transport system permease component
LTYILNSLSQVKKIGTEMAGAGAGTDFTTRTGATIFETTGLAMGVAMGLAMGLAMGVAMGVGAR